MRSTTLTADQPVGLLTIDPVGTSAVMPKGANAWVQWRAFFPDNPKAKALVEWLVLTREKGADALPIAPFELGHRGSGALQLPAGGDGVEIIVRNITPGGVVAFHLDGLGHA